MFAVIGQKIVDRLSSWGNFVRVNGQAGSELIPNPDFETGISNWTTGPTPPRFLFYDSAQKAMTVDTQGVLFAEANTLIQLTQGKKYAVSYTYSSIHSVSAKIIYDNVASPVYEETKPASTHAVTSSFVFTATATAYHTFTFVNNSSAPSADGTLYSASVKEVVTDGSEKVFPVIIPQGTNYPAVTYEISNVSNFMSKGSSLNSCNLSVRIACFADGYGTTYNQAKAIVEALDLYSVSYTEDGQSYTAKFRFIDLDDEYFKNAEKFYKNINFDCLIIKS